MSASGVGDRDAANQRGEHDAAQSAVPIVAGDRVLFVCAGCGQTHEWWGSLWGTWDTGRMKPVSVRKRDGRWVRFMVPVMARGRVSSGCARELKDWRLTREPAVTMVKEKR